MIRPQHGLVGPHVPPVVACRPWASARPGWSVHLSGPTKFGASTVRHLPSAPFLTRSLAQLLIGIDRCCVPTCVTRLNFRAALTIVAALGDRQAHRLLDVGVHAGLHGQDGDPRPGVGRGLDHHAIELFLGDHPPEVFVGLPGLRPVDPFGEIVDAGREAIADRGQANLGDGEARSGDVLGPAAQADDADVHPLVGARLVGPAEDVGRNQIRQGNAGRRGRAEKTPPTHTGIHGIFSWLVTSVMLNGSGHPERSEGSRPACRPEILRCAQNDGILATH